MANHSGRRWRFSADVTRVSREASANPTWTLSAELTTTFKDVAAHTCDVLKNARVQCQKQKLYGAIHALEQLAVDLKSHGDTSAEPRQVTAADLCQACHRILDTEARVESDETAPLPPPPRPAFNAPPMYSHATSERGWEMVDDMVSDPEFRMGCWLFTQFFKQRTREIRLAFVSGVRDAVSDVTAIFAPHGATKDALDIPQVLTMCNEQTIVIMQQLSMLENPPSAQSEPSHSQEGSRSASAPRLDARHEPTASSAAPSHDEEAPSSAPPLSATLSACARPSDQLQSSSAPAESLWTRGLAEARSRKRDATMDVDDEDEDDVDPSLGPFVKRPCFANKS